MSRILHIVIEKPMDCPFRTAGRACTHPDQDTVVPKEFFGMGCDEENTGEFPLLCLLPNPEEGAMR